jgi:hypothetical protein
MPKEVITLTRDLFDEMLQAATDKERNRILAILKDIQDNDVHAVIQGHCPCMKAVKAQSNV